MSCGTRKAFFGSTRIFDSVLPEIVVGTHVKRGQKLGMMGKTGPSGNFSHLHLGSFLSRADVDAGRMNNKLNLYPWLVAAYRAHHPDRLCAAARPHHTILTGETVRLDGSRSLAPSGSTIVSWRWVFHDGRTVDDAKAEKVFDKPGSYVAALWVKDVKGVEDVDFCQIKVFSRTNPESGMPTIFMSHNPTENIRAGQPVALRLWFQGDKPGRMEVDLGDGDRVNSYSEISHSFKTPGIHIVSARCEANGEPFVQMQKVVVGP